jgi:rubrerythrin
LTTNLHSPILTHMTTINDVVFLKDGEPFELSEVQDGVLAIFTGNYTTSKNSTRFISQIEEYYKELNSAGVSVYYSTKEEIECDSKSVLFDPMGEFTSLCSKVCRRNNDCEALLFFKKEGDSFEHLYTRENPESQYDWMEHVLGFANNFANSEPDSQGLWRHGQKVPEKSDWMCVDCGYIMTLSEDDIFPTCEVCFSGDPVGPTDGPEQGYWEKI